MSFDFDICVIGSGAGGGPIALELSKAGYSVLVLEKGPWFTENDYFKDEIAVSRRPTYIPDTRNEPHIIETQSDEGTWYSRPTTNSSWNFWNGNVVGGSTNFMSGHFHRLKPNDFRLLSTYGPIKGANIADWPIDYDELEPYYAKVEYEIGVSGRVTPHRFLEPRSTKDFPLPPTHEHYLSNQIDLACKKIGFEVIPTPRAILSKSTHADRNHCSYSGYCGSYGCSTGAKGSSRAALLTRAIKTGRCQIIANAMVSRLNTDNTGKVVTVEYFDTSKNKHTIQAQIFVVACQAIETARLLLNSNGEKFPDGLANGSGQVGRNLLFAGGGAGSGLLSFEGLPDKEIEQLKSQGPFINRTIQQWYEINDPLFGKKTKGGTIDIVHRHPAPISRATRQLFNDGKLVWGKPLKDKLRKHFTEAQYLKIEAFCDWLPTDNCFVSLDNKIKDEWGIPVAKIRIAFHEHNLKVGWFLSNKGANVLSELGAKNVIAFASGSPPTNLVAGSCRFGDNPKTSVLNADCRAHEVENLYITDGSFMPTGGSVPYTFTIYANSFRVADKIIQELGGPKPV